MARFLSYVVLSPQADHFYTFRLWHCSTCSHKTPACADCVCVCVCVCMCVCKQVMCKHPPHQSTTPLVTSSWYAILCGTCSHGIASRLSIPYCFEEQSKNSSACRPQAYLKAALGNITKGIQIWETASSILVWTPALSSSSSFIDCGLIKETREEGMPLPKAIGWTRIAGT